MQISRSEARYKAMTILYQISLYEKNNISYNIEDVINEQLELKNDFVNEIVFGVLEHEDELVDIANKYLKDWTIDRLSKVDKAILSLGIYELMYTRTPAIVCINETIELAKKYSDLEVVKMINATMDAIYHNEDMHGKQ